MHTHSHPMEDLKYTNTCIQSYTFPNKCIQSYNKHTHSQPMEDLKYTNTCIHKHTQKDIVMGHGLQTSSNIANTLSIMQIHSL